CRPAPPPAAAPPRCPPPLLRPAPSGTSRSPSPPYSSPLPATPHSPLPPPPPPRRHRPPPRDREDVLHAHQKRLVHVPLWRRDVTVHRIRQLPDAPHPRVALPPHLRLLLH